MNFQGVGTFGGLSVGSYTITVEDSFGCQTTVSTTLTEPTDLSGSINSQDNVTCNGDDDGEVPLEVGVERLHTSTILELAIRLAEHLPAWHPIRIRWLSLMPTVAHSR